MLEINKVRIAIIGVGSFGQHHARIINGIEDAELSAVVDSDAARGNEISGKHGVSFYSSIEAINDEIDGVVIVTPTGLHAETAQYFLDKNINVFVEKPITDKSNDALKLIQTAESKGLVLHVGHVERFNPAFLSVRESIKEPIYLETNRVSPFPARIKDADVVFDMMIHDLDIVLSLVDSEVLDIKAIGMKVLTEVADIAQVRLEFENGTVANLTASRVTESKCRKLRVYEKNQYTSVDFLNRSSYQAKTIITDGKKQIQINNPDITELDQLQFELSNFIAAIRGEDNIGVNGIEAYRALKVAEGIAKVMKFS
ncbi:MAG: Gfo/Idh/MocA family oxidoreductase [Acidobacteria bacterium]|nr:Gfo/Idh/MocA family oxidoreductase [Acidobacteriota bacterium]